MNLPLTKMERCDHAAQNAAGTVKHLRDIGLTSDADAVNELLESVKDLRETLIQMAEAELEEVSGELHTQADVLKKLDDYSLIFREKIYTTFLEKVNSLTLKGGCYDLPFDAAVKEIQSLGDKRVFDYLNALTVNVQYHRGRMSFEIKKILPDLSNYKIWQEIRKFAVYKKTVSRGIEYAAFFGKPVTPVNYLR